jgi:hypothetical protein
MKRIAIAICVLLTNSLFAAAPISISGQGTAPYTNLFGKPEKAVEDLAKVNAITDAINRALENQTESLRQQFKSAGQSIKLEDYFSKKLITELSTTLINDDKVEKTLTVRFEGKLDITALRDALNAVPAEDIVDSVKRSDASVVVFFSVRESTGVTIHDDEVKKEGGVNSSVASNSEAEGDLTVTDTGTSKSESSLKQKKQQVKESSSGSVKLKTDKIDYELDQNSKEAFGEGLKARFISKGIKEIIDGAMFDCAEVLDEAYGSGGSPKSKDFKAITENILTEEPDVQFFIIGSLDFSYPTNDPVTGMPTYNGTITGKVYKMREPGKMPTYVSGLAPLESKQSASTQQDAKKRVVAQLAELAADEIISQLRANKVLKQ